MKFRFVSVTVLGLAMSALSLPQAHAALAPNLQLTDNAGNTVTIDGSGMPVFGGSCTALTCTTIISTGANGVVTWDGTLGNFTLNVTTGTSKPTSLALFPTLMDLNSVNANTVGAGTLTILWSDSGWNSGLTGTGFNLHSGGTAANGTVDFSAYLDTTNALLTTPAAGKIGDTGPMGPGGFSSNIGGLIAAPAGTFSMTEKLVLAFTAAGQDSGDFSLDGVPEPASVALLGGVLLCTVSAIRRKTVRRS